jgi:arginase
VDPKRNKHAKPNQPTRGEIALLGIPFDLGAGQRGSVMGPTALRIAGMAEGLRDLDYTVTDHGDLPMPKAAPHDFAMPEGKCNSPAEIAGWMRAIHDAAYGLLRAKAIPVFLGGDHTIAIGTLSAVARHCAEVGKELMVLWIDAHGDFNTPLTSPTGNMHGMPAAFLCGDPSLAGILGDRPFVPLDPKSLFLFGLRSIDPIERKALRDGGIACSDMGQIDDVGVSAVIRPFLERIAGRNVHLHVSLDADAIDPTVVPGVGTPVPGGLTYRETHLIMELLHRSGLVGSVDLVELNPFLDERGRSAYVLAELAASLFGRTVLGGPL